jgi:hypothetical protein
MAQGHPALKEPTQGRDVNSLPAARSPGALEQLTNGLQVWVVTRYGDVRATLADPDLSLSKSRARLDLIEEFAVLLLMSP